MFERLSSYLHPRSTPMHEATHGMDNRPDDVNLSHLPKAPQPSHQPNTRLHSGGVTDVPESGAQVTSSQETTDPESLRPIHDKSRQKALQKKFTEEEEPVVKLDDVVGAMFRQAQMEVKEDEPSPLVVKKEDDKFPAGVNYVDTVQGISKTKAGDYNPEFVKNSLYYVAANMTAEALSVASCIAAAYGLVQGFAPNSPMGGTPSGLQGPGNAPSTTATTGTGYSWKDMGTTSILAGSPFLMKPAFKDFYLGLMTTFMENGKHDPISAMEANFNEYLRTEYEPFKSKDAISPDVKVAVEKVICTIQGHFDYLRPDKTKRTNMQLSDLPKTKAFILAGMYWLKAFLPLAENGLPLKETPGWRDSDETLKKMLATGKAARIYKDPLTRSQMCNLPLSQACRSVEKSEYAIPEEMLKRPMKGADELPDKGGIEDWHHWHEVEDIPQKNTLAAGRAGGGKTFIKKVMKIWEPPEYDQTYQPLHQGGVAAGEPAKWLATQQTEYITREHNLLGERAFKTFVTQFRNAMRWLDEPSWEDKEGVKRDTDPNVDKLHSECIEASWRILEQCTTAMANSVPTVEKLYTTREIIKDIDPAFLSRFELILVEECDPETMREFAKGAYKALAARFCLPFKDGAPKAGEEQKLLPPKLDKDQQERLLSAFQSVLDRLVEHHNEKKGELRMYTDVEPIFMTIVNRLLMEKAPGHPRMENEDIQQWVEDYFERMPNRNAYSKANQPEEKGKAPENQEFRALQNDRDRLQREKDKLQRENDEMQQRIQEFNSRAAPLDEKPIVGPSKIDSKRGTQPEKEKSRKPASSISSAGEQQSAQETEAAQEKSRKKSTVVRMGAWMKRHAHLPHRSGSA